MLNTINICNDYLFCGSDYNKAKKDVLKAIIDNKCSLGDFKMISDSLIDELIKVNKINAN